MINIFSPKHDNQQQQPLLSYQYMQKLFSHTHQVDIETIDDEVDMTPTEFYLLLGRDKVYSNQITNRVKAR